MRREHRFLSESERGRVREQHAAGMSFREISRRWGCSDSTARRIVDEQPRTESKRGVEESGGASDRTLAAAGLMPEPVIPRCLGCCGEGYREYDHGRERCEECEGRGYLRPAKRRRA